MVSRSKDTRHDSLPRYSCLSAATSVSAHDRPDAHSRTTHSLLCTSNALRLTLSNSSASSPHRVPVYFEGDALNGVVHVTAEKGDSIQSLTIAVICKMTTGTTEPQIFLEIGRTLWRRVLGSGLLAEKMRGECEFAFSLDLPLKISFDGQDATRLPQTFTQRDLRVSVSYELVVTLGKGRLRSDVTFKTPFVYIPLTAPPDFSPLRRLAYKSRSVAALADPTSDPDGWYSLAPVPISVTSSRPVQIVCELSLAAPLCYTRGSILPLHIVFSAETTADRDEAVASLNLISFPSVVSQAIVLRRHIRWAGKRGAFRDEYSDIGSPIFWRTRTDVDLKKALQGEIILPSNLVPNFDLGMLSVSYEMVLKEFCPPGMACTHAVLLESSKSGKAIWTMEPIKIASTFGSRPRPVSYAPKIHAGTDHRAESLSRLERVHWQDLTYTETGTWLGPM